MARKLAKATTGLAALILLGALAIYATAKPYQQERILTVLGLKTR